MSTPWLDDFIYCSSPPMASRLKPEHMQTYVEFFTILSNIQRRIELEKRKQEDFRAEVRLDLGRLLLKNFEVG